MTPFVWVPVLIIVLIVAQWLVSDWFIHRSERQMAKDRRSRQFFLERQVVAGTVPCVVWLADFHQPPGPRLIPPGEGHSWQPGHWHAERKSLDGWDRIGWTPDQSWPTRHGDGKS